MNKQQFNDFDWSQYDENYNGGNHLSINKKITGQNNKNKCYSRESYAQELFDKFTSNQLIVKKDLVRGDYVKITNIFSIKGEKMMIELSGGLSVEIDLGREKRFLQIFGFETIKDFINALQEPGFIRKFIDQGLYAYVIESAPTIKISLWQGHIKKTKEEFMKEIEFPSKAYVAKIYEANKGGFFVEVQGVEAFMPGSLAAPNKIIDFKSYVGKEVIVMIEDFLSDINSFIVSHKKYIEHVLPKKIEELDLNKKYSGTVTGTSKYGIFIEFEDIFTGLLHNSKMKEETISLFRKGAYTPGTQIHFYINEITKDNRIILTEESPEEKREKFNKFIEENKDKILISEVAAVMTFGIIVNVGELSGLIPNKEFKKRKISIKNFIIGDLINVKLAGFKEDKLVFTLEDKWPDKKNETQEGA